MSITFSAFDILYFALGMFVGYMIPHARRYYGNYRRYRGRRRY